MSSIIQNIRDKYARIAVVAIALSLLGFILMDALNNRTGGFLNRRSNKMGSVNGVAIKADDFEKKVSIQEENMRANNQSMSTLQREQMRESIWNNEVEKAVMTGEFEKLGFRIGKKEINDIILNNPTENLYMMAGGQQGAYNGQGVQQYIAERRKSKVESEILQVNELSNQIVYDRKMEKYKNIMISTVSYPKWFFEKQNADRGAMAKASYVAVPYDVIKDSTVTVTDAEINAYISKHKELYKQPENRSIRYVTFSAAPTVADSLANRDRLTELKAKFAADTNTLSFISANSQIPYSDLYVSKTQMQIPAKDSVQRLSKGQLYGPYLDGANYTVAKMLDIKNTYDSVKVRHILIKTFEPQSNQTLMPDSVGKKRADSLLAAIRAGANFDSLVVRFSGDEGSVAKGGVYEFDYATNFMPEFKDFAYNNPAGTKGIVKTAYGYHIMDVMNQKGSQSYYKVAYLSKKIVASDDTEKEAASKAQSFSSAVNNAKSFEEVAKKNNYSIFSAENIKPNDYSIGVLSNGEYCKELIRQIYSANKGGIVSTQDPVGLDYVVAIVSEVFEEGTMSASAARAQLNPLLIKKKKAEQIKQKIGKISTLEAVAGLYNVQVQNADSVRLDGSRPFGLGVYEPRLLGATFNPDNKGKVVPEALEGSAGVYVVRVDDITATPAMDNSNPEAQAKQAEAGTRQSMMNPQQNMFGGMGSPAYNPADLLKKSATIKDNRARVYQQ